MTRLLAAYIPELPTLIGFTSRVDPNPHDGSDQSTPGNLNMDEIHEAGRLIWKASEDVANIL